MSEFFLKKQGVKYVEKSRSDAFRFTSTRHKNLTRSVATNRLRNMFLQQIRNAAAAEQRNQRLEQIMLFDRHVKYAKSIGVEDKIRFAL